MSDDKTEEPTQKRLDDQRKEGQVPQRKNVLEAIVLTASFLLLLALTDSFRTTIVALIKISNDAVRLGIESIRPVLVRSIGDLLLLVAAYMGGIFSVALLAGLFLNRFNFAPKAMTPKFEKFNPASNVKSLFSKNTLYNFFRILIIFIVLAYLLYSKIISNVANALNASHCGTACFQELSGGIIRSTISTILLVLIVLAAIDYKLQTKMFISQNKMSKEDLKREYKGQEGDPQIKSARKSIAFEDAHQPTMRDVTHVVHGETYLVGIIYSEQSRQRPLMALKVRGAGVARMLSKARAHRVPIVNLPLVAQEFYTMAVPGQYLPPNSAVGLTKILEAVERARQ